MSKKLIELLSTILTPPGSGVYTVSAGADKRNPLHLKLYGQTNGVQNLWKNSLNSLAAQPVLLLGIPSDTGGGILRGANWGPLYLREQLIQTPAKYFDLGDVPVVPFILHDKYLNEKTLRQVRKFLYPNKKTYPVSPLSIAEKVCLEIYHHFPDKRIFGVGGDHSCSYPLVKTYFKAKKTIPALIHFDAHTDLLNERQGIDICFGTWVAQVLKYLPSPKHCIQIGIRTSGKPKAHWEKTLGIKQYWSQEILQNGVNKIGQKMVKHLKEQKVQELYISFDLDCLDAAYAMSTGTPEKNGLSPFDAICLIQILSQEFPITGADFMELAPHVNGDNLPTLLSSQAISSHLIESLWP